MIISSKVLPRVVLSTLAALLLTWSAGGIPKVGAQVFSVSPEGGGRFLSGGNLVVAVSAQDDAGDLIITATGATNPMLTVTSCLILRNLNCAGIVTGDGTNSVTIKTDILDVPEEVAEPLRVTLNLTAACESATPIVVTASQGATGPVLAEPSVICQPDPTPKFAGSANIANIGCAGTSVVTFVPNVSVGAQTLNLAATVGTLSPASVSYVGSGAVSTTFSGPVAPFSGTATIRIQTTTGPVLGRVSVTISCLAATATAPVSPSAASTSVPRAGIVPPSTGDGGLLADRPASPPALAAALVATLALVSFAGIRRRGPWR